jgi:hypothetical protein
MPADAPNRFVINIQPEQRAAVAQMAGRAGRRCRIGADGAGASAAHQRTAGQCRQFPEDDRAQRLIEREFNLSWRTTLPEGNLNSPPGAGSRCRRGQPWQGPGQASVEAGLAKTLGIALGDELVFSVAGMEKNVRVTSLRKLEWDSMRVNFFVLTPPGVLDDLPASYAPSVRLPQVLGAPFRPGAFPAHVARRDGRARLGLPATSSWSPATPTSTIPASAWRWSGAARGAGFPRRHHQPAGLEFSADFRAGQAEPVFGVTAGNMDSMVNRYTSDRKIRSDDAYTPNARRTNGRIAP